LAANVAVADPTVWSRIIHAWPSFALIGAYELLNTRAKYRTYLDTHLLPQWEGWPLGAIFNDYLEIERWVATPAQFLRAGLVLALMSGYTGARWSELVALRPHDYDEINHAIPVRTPLREVAGKLEIAKSPQTPAGKRWVQMPPFLDGLYTDLIGSCKGDGRRRGAVGGPSRHRAGPLTASAAIVVRP
jgi:integrase